MKEEVYMIEEYLVSLGWKKDSDGLMFKNNMKMSVIRATIYELNKISQIQNRAYVTCPDCDYGISFNEFLTLSGIE